MLSKQFSKDSLGWGFILWLVGYVVSILLFPFVPVSALGWIITPVGIAFLLWVLLKKIKEASVPYYVRLGLVWTIMAIILDYIFIVKAFNPEDGYYKFDVYLYYATTFLLPILVGWWKDKKN